jgi:negative regulator of sigma E activity
MNLGTLWRIVKAMNVFKSAEQEVRNMPANAPKPWYASLTIWANAAMALLATFTPELQGFVAGHPKIAVAIAAITNVLLRFKTDKPVA